MPAGDDQRELRALLLRRRRFTLDILARFHPLPKRTYNAPRGTWKRELLAENPAVRENDPSIARLYEANRGQELTHERPDIDGAIEAFLTDRGSVAGEWGAQFIAAHEALLAAGYIDGWDLHGRDWEPRRSPGWTWLGAARKMRWTEELLDRYADALDWRELSGHPDLPWSEAILARYEARWDWSRLADNEGIPWTADLVRRFRRRLDPKKLSGNSGVPYDVLVEALGDDLHYGELSAHTRAPWSESFIAAHVDAWRWQRLSMNRGLPWSVALIKRFEDRWSWPRLGRVAVLHDEILEVYGDRWDWSELSGRTWEGWPEERLRRWADRLDWKKVSARRPPATPGELLAFEDRWDWPRLAEHRETYERCVRPFVDAAFIEVLIGRR